MCCSSQSYSGRTLVKLLVCGLLANSAVILRHASAADSSSLLPVVPQSVQWLSGPIDAPLAGVAGIRVPAGLRFTDAKGARVLLESAQAPVPEDLAGLIAPVTADWWITLEYASSGHVSIGDQGKLDQEALLKAFWSQTTQERKTQGLPELTHINWATQPSYHAARQYFDYAVRLESFSAKDQKLVYVACFLGRHGVLQARVTYPWHDGDATPFKEALRGVAFKEGERYDDFTPGDKTAAGALAELITAQKGPAQMSVGTAEAKGGGMKAFWAGFGVIGFIGLTGVALIARKRAKAPAEAAAAVPQPEPAVQQHAPSPNGTKPFKLNVKPKPVVKPINGNGHPERNGNNPKRRRMFNYHKFYTEMVLQGPTPSIAEPINGFNGYPNGYDTEHGGNGNGNGNGLSGHSRSEPQGVVLNAHSELIANQKALIEEQQRLIHEQARLIEEKTKLIAEKNDLLDRQSQMIDNNLL